MWGTYLQVRKATSPPKARQGQQQQFARSPAPHVATASPISNAVPSLAGLQSNLLQNHLQQQTMNMFLAQHPLVLQSELHDLLFSVYNQMCPNPRLEACSEGVC